MMINNVHYETVLVGLIGSLLKFAVESKNNLSVVRVAPTIPMVAVKGSPDDLPKCLLYSNQDATN